MIVNVNKYMRRKILKLAWPVVLEMFWIMVVNVSVTAMVGKFGAVALAAVGLSAMVQFSSAMVFAAVGTGAASIVARESGAGNWEDVRLVAGQAVLLGLVLGSLLAISGYFIAPALFILTGAEPEVAGLGSALLKIGFIFTPFFLVFSIGNAVLRGLGQTKTAFYISSASNTFALLLSFMLINGYLLPGIGPYGAAWGTGVSQLIGGIAVLVVLSFNGKIKLNWHKVFSIRAAVLKRIVAISVPAGLEQLALQGGRVAYTFMLAKAGAIQFAAHQIAVQVESISFMPGFGFSVAAMTLVGQYIGKGLPHRSAQYAWLTNKIAILSMTAMGVVFFLFAERLTALFISDTDVIYWGSMLVMIAAFEQPTIAITYVLGGALRGAGDTKWPMYVTITGVWLFRMPLIYLFVVVWNYDLTAAWYITVGDFFLRSIILWWRFASNKWQDSVKTKSELISN
ncbi:MAG: MATE family efflux transporter [Veillonellaceae bacterium]|nr:MATE family efflux transporter [Veillonellaceae bacterium]